MFKKFEACCGKLSETWALDSLSQVTDEARLLTETKDILDELDIIVQVLRDQYSVGDGWQGPPRSRTVMRDLITHIAYVEDIEKIKKLATRTQDAVSP